MKKLIISAALSGAASTKAHAPTVPYTAEEIAADTVKVAGAGAAIVHIHVRDEEGRGVVDADRFEAAYHASVEALEKAGLDAIINLTTSGGDATVDMRLEHIRRIRPEMCSYNAGSINWGRGVYYNPPELLERLGTLIQETGTKAEIEIFDSAMITNVKRCVERGFLKAPCHFQFVVGIEGGMDATMKNISFLVDQLPEGSTWSLTGIGGDNLPMMLLGLGAGADGVRTGLEDCVRMKKGVVATNEALVRRAAELARLADREIASADEARELLGVKRR